MSCDEGVVVIFFLPLLPLFFLFAPILLPHSHRWQSCLSPLMGDPKFQHTGLQELFVFVYLTPNLSQPGGHQVLLRLALS